MRISIRHAIGPYEDLFTTVRKRKVDGMGTLQDQQELQRWSYRARYKEEKEKQIEKAMGRQHIIMEVV